MTAIGDSGRSVDVSSAAEPAVRSNAVVGGPAMAALAVRELELSTQSGLI